jgi:hypothetical protein
LEKFKVYISLIVFVLLALPIAYAAGPFSPVYMGPSEAYRFSGATNATCQNGVTLAQCNDSQFLVVSDEFTFSSDGSTSASSGYSVQDRASTQTAFAKLTYDLDGVYDGSYVLRWATASSAKIYNYTVCSYLDDFVTVNQSSCLNYKHYADGNNWAEQDVSSLVDEMADKYNNRVVFRFFITDDGDDNSITVTEIYLRRPYRMSDFNVFAMGVSEVEANTRAENTWNIISQEDLPLITNYSCRFYRLNDINSSAYVINASLLNVAYEVANDSRYFKVYWDANTSVDGIDEGYNVEVECEGYFGDVHFKEFSQFVYVNRLRTIFVYLNQFVVWVQQLLGIASDTQQLVSGDVSVPDMTVYSGQLSYVTSFVNYADGTIDDADCYLSAWYPNSSIWLDDQLMSATGSAGRYTYAVSPYDVGSYALRVFCNGTSLKNRTRYSSGVMNVVGSVSMEMIS